MVAARKQNDDKSIWRCLLVVGCSTSTLIEALATLVSKLAQVNSWPKNNSCVEAARPSHCQRCSAPCRDSIGGIRLQGHGQRYREALGPPKPEAAPAMTVVIVRRYRCTDCGATTDVSPPGMAKRYRYSLPAMALALFLWGSEKHQANRVRDQISPHCFEGLNRNQRWRSLLRWAVASPTLFRFNEPRTLLSYRQAAERAAAWIRQSRPPGGSERERIFLAAQVY